MKVKQSQKHWKVIIKRGIKMETTKCYNCNQDLEIKQLKDTIHRSNMQIKDLKEQLKYIKVDLKVTENNLKSNV